MDILSIFTDLGSSFGTISDPMNRVFHIKSGHDFSRYRNSIQVICFQMNNVFTWRHGGHICAAITTKEMAAMIVSRANPQRTELYSHANFFFCLVWNAWKLVSCGKPAISLLCEYLSRTIELMTWTQQRIRYVSLRYVWS